MNKFHVTSITPSLAKSTLCQVLTLVSLAAISTSTLANFVLEPNSNVPSSTVTQAPAEVMPTITPKSVTPSPIPKAVAHSSPSAPQAPSTTPAAVASNTPKIPPTAPTIIVEAPGPQQPSTTQTSPPPAAIRMDENIRLAAAAPASVVPTSTPKTTELKAEDSAHPLSSQIIQSTPVPTSTLPRSETIPATQTESINKPSTRSSQPIHAYHADTYEFSFKTFVEAHNLEDAYSIAKAAVEQDPGNLKWHERLAVVATWTQRPAVSLQQWQYLAAHGKDDDEVINHIITLAVGLRDDAALVTALKVKVARHPDDMGAWEQLAASYERLNEPQQAIQLLEQGYAKNPNQNYLSIIAYLYKSIGEPQQESAEIQRIISSYGVTTDLALRESELSYSGGHIDTALSKLLAAKGKAKPTDFNYWRTLSDLAWMAQDYSNAVYASEILYKQGHAAAEDYSRIINVMQTTNPHFAMQLSEEGWKKFHQPLFFLSMMDLGSKLEEWGTLRDAYLSLTPDDKKQLAVTPYYWTTLAMVWQQLGNLEQSRLAYLQALQLDPNDLLLKTGYIWLLIDQNNKMELAQKMTEWAPLIAKDVRLWDAFTYGALALNLNPLALKLFNQELPLKLKDFPWQIAFAARLEDSDLIPAAYWMRNYAWRGVQKSLLQQKTPITNEDWFPYTELAAVQAPGDVAYEAMVKLGQYPFQLRNLNMLLAWSVATSNFALADFLLQYYQEKHLTVPAVMELNIALNANDLPVMQNLVTPSDTHSTKEILNEVGDVDARDAALRLGQRGLMEQYAYDGMDQIQLTKAQQTPNYQLLAQTMVDQANNVFVQSQYFAFGSVTQIQTLMSTRIHLNPNVYVTPFVSYAPQWSNDESLITGVPHFDEEAGVNLNYLDNRNNWQFGAGERSDLNTFATAHISDSYQWNAWINLNVLAGYMERSYLTAPMLVGGAENVLQATVTDNIDNHNFIVAQEEGDEYVSQTGSNLGWGNLLNGEIDHRFTLDYPDIGVRAFGQVAAFAHTGGLTNSLESLIPAGQPTDVDYFIPGSFSQWGFGTYFGQLYKDNYTSLIRPYGAADVFYNTVTGLGYDASGGISMSVLGDDQLALFVQYSQGSGGVAQQTLAVGSSYKYLF